MSNIYRHSMPNCAIFLAYYGLIPEKALADKIQADRGTAIRTQKEMRTYLLDSMRIDPEGLGRLNPETISRIADQYRSRKLRLLRGLLRRLGGKGEGHE